MGEHEPCGWNATLERTLLTARNAATVTRLVTLHPPCCPLVRAAFEHMLARTVGAWSLDYRAPVRAQATARRKLEPVLLQRARALQPRKGEAR
jgi:hypothetical protein